MTIFKKGALFLGSTFGITILGYKLMTLQAITYPHIAIALGVSALYVAGTYVAFQLAKTAWNFFFRKATPSTAPINNEPVSDLTSDVDNSKDLNQEPQKGNVAKNGAVPEPFYLEPLDSADQGQPSDVADQGQPSDAADQGQPSDAADQGQPSDAADQGQPSDSVDQGPADQGQPSDTADQGPVDQGQPSDVAADQGHAPNELDALLEKLDNLAQSRHAELSDGSESDLERSSEPQSPRQSAGEDSDPGSLSGSPILRRHKQRNTANMQQKRYLTRESRPVERLNIQTHQYRTYDGQISTSPSNRK